MLTKGDETFINKNVNSRVAITRKTWKFEFIFIHLEFPVALILLIRVR